MINVTHGMACEIRTENQVERLVRYEIEVYRLKESIIKLADGREVGGKSFIWNAEEKLLKERKIDLKDWQMEQLVISSY